MTEQGMGVTDQGMGVWPEDRIRARVAAGEGRLEMPLERLLAEFGARRSTPLARQTVEQALRDAGLEVQPSLREADLHSAVTVSLPSRPNGELRSDAPTPPPRLPQPGTRRPADHQPVERLREAMTHTEQHDVDPASAPPERPNRPMPVPGAAGLPPRSPNGLERDLALTRERLQSARADFERRLAEAGAELEAARREVADSRARGDRAAERVGALERTLENARRQLSDEGRRSSELSHQVEELERENDRQRDRAGDLQARLEALAGRLDAQGAAHDGERDRLAAQLKGVQAQLDGERELRAVRDAELQDVRTRAEQAASAAEERSRALQEALDSLGGDLTRERGRASDLTERVQRLEGENHDLRRAERAMRETIGHELEEATRALSEARASLADERRQRVSADREIQSVRLDLQARASTATDALKRTRLELERERNRAKSLEQQLQSSRGDFNRQAGKASAAVRSARANFERERDQREELERRLQEGEAASRRDSAAAEQRLSQAETALSDAQAEIASERGRREALAERLSRLEQELQEQRATQQRLEHLQAVSERELAAAQRRTGELEAALAAARGEEGQAKPPRESHQPLERLTAMASRLRPR